MSAAHATTLQWETGQGERQQNGVAPLPEDEAAALLEQLRLQRRDQDRLRLLRNAAVNHSMTCHQICDFVKVFEVSRPQLALRASTRASGRVPLR